MRGPELLDTATALARRSNKRPKQADLRRAQSTAYYAMFHCLARQCADNLIGGANAARSNPAWCQVYRALEHGAAKNACTDGAIAKFPAEVQDFASLFKEMQEKRHAADYDPDYRLRRSEVLSDIETVSAAIERLEACGSSDRAAFCAFVLFKKR